MSTPQQPRVGDVVSAEIDRVAGSRADLYGIRVPLHGHAHRYVVGVQTDSRGPRLVSLTVESADAATISPAVLRAIPTRRLAHAAARWALAADGKFASPLLGVEAATMTEEEVEAAMEEASRRKAENDARPDVPTSRNRHDEAHYRRVAEAARTAAAKGLPVRNTVATQMNTSVPTVDRWIRKAKDLSLLGEDELPTRKPRTMTDEETR